MGDRYLGRKGMCETESGRESTTLFLRTISARTVCVTSTSISGRESTTKRLEIRWVESLGSWNGNEENRAKDTTVGNIGNDVSSTARRGRGYITPVTHRRVQQVNCDERKGAVRRKTSQ